MLMSLDRLLNKVCGSVGEIQENARCDGVLFTQLQYSVLLWGV